PAAAHAGDQRDVGDQAVHRAEHGRPQPAPGHVGVVPLVVGRRTRLLAEFRHGRVRMSAPSSVTTRVCSNCAVQRRSLVTTVQPSGQVSYWYVPSVIIGSTVNVMPTSMIVDSCGSA